MNQTLPRSCRLSTSLQVRQVMSSGNKLRAGCVSVSFAENGLHTARIALNVAKKNYASAVVRNAIKRTARESFRQHRVTIPGVDVVVTVHRVNNLDLTRLGRTLDKLWQQATLST